MKMGTKIPPPVHAKIMLMNLYEKGALGPNVLKTLQPFQIRNRNVSPLDILYYKDFNVVREMNVYLPCK